MFSSAHIKNAFVSNLFQNSAKLLAAIYGGSVLLALLAAVGFTNLYLTKHLFRHIQEPLDALVSGVKRIQDGNLDSPIAYQTQDEFQPACEAVDEMAARLKASLEAQSRQQQQKQELIAGMSHDLKSPLTAIRDRYSAGKIYTSSFGGWNPWATTSPSPSTSAASAKKSRTTRPTPGSCKPSRAWDTG